MEIVIGLISLVAGLVIGMLIANGKQNSEKQKLATRGWM